MVSRLQTYAKDVLSQQARRYRQSAVGAMVSFVRDTYNNLVIDNRKNKNSDLLIRMHKEIRNTPRLPCNPNATCELHTLTAHHHLDMYLTALKSLLIHFSDIAVVTHDDGSLTDEDKALLITHVNGIKIIDKAAADEKMTAILADYPHCRALRTRIVNSLELLDNIVLAKTEKTINMNSDVLFFKRPDELISWIEGDSTDILGVFEAQPAEQKAFLKAHRSRFSPHVTTALTCFYKSLLDLDFVERILENTRCGWFTSQNIFPLLYERKKHDHKTLFFDEETYQASGKFDAKPIYRHYWTSTGLFITLQTEDSRRVIVSLKDAS